MESEPLWENCTQHLQMICMHVSRYYFSNPEKHPLAKNGKSHSSNWNRDELKKPCQLRIALSREQIPIAESSTSLTRKFEGWAKKFWGIFPRAQFFTFYFSRCRCSNFLMDRVCATVIEAWTEKYFQFLKHSRMLENRSIFIKHTLCSCGVPKS